MAQVHPTAILEGDIELGEDVVLGPNCVLTGPITIGAGTQLLGGVYLNGPLRLGEGNALYPYVCLGFAPQSLGYDPDAPGCGLEIGDRNRLRESVTIHRAMTDEGPTRIGDDNYFMVNSHAGHDSQIGSHCIFANDTLLAGHVVVGDRVITGGAVVVHQYCRIGRGAMLTGTMAMNKDLPPWFMLTGPNICGSVNLVGLRRNGFSREQIDTVRWVHRTLFRSGRSLRLALEDLQTRADDELVAEYIDFVTAADRGICTTHGRAIHGTA